MPTVYVVHSPLKKGLNGSFVPMYDLSDARRYGRLVEVIPNHMVGRLGSTTAGWERSKDLTDSQLAKSRMLMREICAHAERVLKDFTKDDYLLLVSNPVLIGVCFAIAADVTDGHVKVLRHDRLRGTYIPLTIDQVFQPEAAEA